FHDGRHTAITTLAEKGLPDWVIQAQVGHVAPAMMKTYSHIRRQALNQAAAALEPTATAIPTPPEKPAPARRRVVMQNELCHSPRHNLRIVAGASSNLLRKMARRTGRFPQLVVAGPAGPRKGMKIVGLGRMSVLGAARSRLAMEQSRP